MNNSNMQSQYQQNPLNTSQTYNAGYESNYLQAQGSAYQPNNQPPLTLPSHNSGLPPIPDQTRLQQFGNLSLTGHNPNIPSNVQNSYATPQYGQTSVSQGLNHSVFPMAQQGTYASYTYPSQNNQVSSSSTSIPWWAWALICLLLAAAVIGGIWYCVSRKQPNISVGVPPVLNTYPVSTPQPVTVTEQVTTTVQNPIQTSVNTRYVQPTDQQDHHHHLRYSISS